MYEYFQFLCKMKKDYKETRILLHSGKRVESFSILYIIAYHRSLINSYKLIK